jgi:hypothetical protein
MNGYAPENGNVHHQHKKLFAPTLLVEIAQIIVCEVNTKKKRKSENILHFHIQILKISTIFVKIFSVYENGLSFF